MQPRPVPQKVMGPLSPREGQGTHLAFGFDSQLECVWEAADQWFSFTLMFLFVSLFFSLWRSINVFSREDLKKKKKEQQ